MNSASAPYRRHDISDVVINALFWILRAGAPWRDLPPFYGDWKNTHRHFYR
ncbi:Putative transposase of IS4/5 family [Nitrosomonas sp. Nm132]|jgi:transposase|nr:Putative transposase of IS4/5 family [Nitrosomonas sp. Nm132]